MTRNELYLWVYDPLERAGKTFVQVYLVLIIGTGSLDLSNHQQWVQALIPALFAAVISLITSGLSLLTGLKVTGAFDLWVRVLKTFVQAFLGVIVASGATTFVAADWKDALAVGVTAAITALLSGLGTLASPKTIGASAIRVAYVKEGALELSSPAALAKR